jgi:uncharacterized protein YodC (DUF2158 family)
MADDFRIGDVVQLKSGGPKMTVEQIGDQGERRLMIRCGWFEGDARKHGSFPPAALKKADA